MSGKTPPEAVKAMTSYTENQQDDILYGNQGADVLYGGQGNDAIYGGQNNDIIYGNLGDDLLFENLGDDTIYGGGSQGANRYTADDYSKGNLSKGDTASFEFSQTPLAGVWSGQGYVVSGDGTDTLIDIDRIIGSSYADSFSVTPEMVLLAGAGDDYITLKPGLSSDAGLVDGGVGNDTFVLDETASTLNFATVRVSAGTDHLVKLSDTGAAVRVLMTGQSSGSLLLAATHDGEPFASAVSSVEIPSATSVHSLAYDFYDVVKISEGVSDPPGNDLGPVSSKPTQQKSRYCLEMRGLT